MLLVCPRLRSPQLCLAFRTIALLLTLVLFSAIASKAIAQEVDSQDQPLAKLEQQWNKIDQSLDEVQQQLESGEGDTDSLRETYADLVDEANAAIENLRNTAMEQIDSNDGKDILATRMLMGILLNSAKEGDDEEVLKAGDFLIEQKVSPIWFETAAKSQRIPIEAREIFDELLIRQRETAAGDLPRVKLTTNRGDIVVELFENEAPETVGNFISLVEADFYKDIDFHRVIEGFMAQTGCPDGTGEGGPGYKIECECDSAEARPHFTGSLSMAHAGKDTGGSQFYLTFNRTQHLDGVHTVFGRVIEGLDVLENIQRTHVSINGRGERIPDIKKDQIVSAKVIRKRNHVYRPNKVGVDEPPLEQPKASEEEQTSKEPMSEETSSKEDSADSDDSVKPKEASESEEAKNEAPDQDANDVPDPKKDEPELDQPEKTSEDAATESNKKSETDSGDQTTGEGAGSEDEPTSNSAS